MTNLFLAAMRLNNSLDANENYEYLFLDPSTFETSIGNDVGTIGDNRSKIKPFII